MLISAKAESAESSLGGGQASDGSQNIVEQESPMLGVAAEDRRH